MNPVFSIEHLVLMLMLVATAGTYCAWRSSEKCSTVKRALITAARLLALLCLGIIAVNPGHWHEEKNVRDSEWAVLIDRSASMATPDAGSKTRWAEACRLAEKAAAASENPASMSIHTFSNELEPTDRNKLDSLIPDGNGTDIIRAGTSLLNRSKSSGRILTGLILISDGRQIERLRETELGIRARAQESPIFAIPLGGEVARKDIRVTAGRRQYTAFAGQPLKISATVKSTGLGSISPVVQLLDESGMKIDERKINLLDQTDAVVSFEITPEKKAYSEYTFKVPGWENEDTESNNEAGTAIAVLDTSIRVFLAEGTPFWDSKFLAQLLRKQPNVEVTSVYRLSAQRFLKVETDASKTEESGESVFPGTAEEAAAYDIVIFGKGAEYFLTPDRAKVLRDFVRDQGGCVIFARGKPYDGTLPLLEYIEPVSWGELLEKPFRLQPTRAGEDTGLFDETLPGADDPLWQKLPQLEYAHKCPEIKTFTKVLAQGIYETGDPGRPVPVILSRRYGKGLTITINAEGMWKWDFFPSTEEGSELYKDFWAQVVQWAVTYSEFLPGQDYALKLSEYSVYPDTPVQVRIIQRGTGTPAAPPVIKVLDKQKILQTANTVAADNNSSEWNAIVNLKEPGSYTIELEAQQTESPRRVRAVLNVRPPPAENDNVSADHDFLRDLAETSGGRIIGEQDIAETVRRLELKTETVDISKATWQPAWDKWWLLVLVLLFFGGECFIRRRNGLM